MNTIFLEILSITHNEATYSWIYNLTNQYSREVKDRGGTVKVVSEVWHDEGGYEEVTLMIAEENAYNHFIEREGKQRLTKVPMFATQSSTNVISYQTLNITVSVYPEAPIDSEFKPKEVSKDKFRLAEPDIGMGKQVVRLTHKPTEIVVICGEEKTQKDNEEMAERLLKAKVYKIKND